MPEEINKPAAKKHHKKTHKHHAVKPHPEGHGHYVVNNATGLLVGHFANEDDAHEFAASLEPEVTIPAPEEPIQ